MAKVSLGSKSNVISPVFPFDLRAVSFARQRNGGIGVARLIQISGNVGMHPIFATNLPTTKRPGGPVNPAVQPPFLVASH